MEEFVFAFANASSEEVEAMIRKLDPTYQIQSKDSIAFELYLRASLSLSQFDYLLKNEDINSALAQMGREYGWSPQSGGTKYFQEVQCLSWNILLSATFSETRSPYFGGEGKYISGVLDTYGLRDRFYGNIPIGNHNIGFELNTADEIEGKVESGFSYIFRTRNHIETIIDVTTTTSGEKLYLVSAANADSQGKPETVWVNSEGLKNRMDGSFSNVVFFRYDENYITSPALPLLKPINLQLTFDTSPDINVKFNKVAMKYKAGNLSEMKAVAEDLNQKYDYGYNLCGPLSISYLKDTGIVASTVNVGDLYKFNPDDVTNPNKLWQLDMGRTGVLPIFPPDKFTYINYLNENNSVGTYDWENNPLKVGDWMYLDSKTDSVGNYDEDTFEHMLTVTRVDDQGRAYSMTNYTTDGGKTFKIEELMLYDPANDKAGMFDTWTDENQENQYGTTGRGGFLIVRPNEDLVNATIGGTW